MDYSNPAHNNRLQRDASIASLSSSVLRRSLKAGRSARLNRGVRFLLNCLVQNIESAILNFNDAEIFSRADEY